MSVVSQTTMTCISIRQVVLNDNSTGYESGLGKLGQEPDLVVVEDHPLLIGCQYQLTLRKLKSPPKEPK